ncbi:hypothetical protein EVAR_8746_1 [Eumeta japonica]|uniref:Uncharacterized protein n=1 Tax=Eumeta variegata TaxID=151549 RepID=A0A4C1TTN4_EUMVA|nr:hypothetical protein EVAR_8746_1 [Eumeta japonica]
MSKIGTKIELRSESCLRDKRRNFFCPRGQCRRRKQRDPAHEVKHTRTSNPPDNRLPLQIVPSYLNIRAFKECAEHAIPRFGGKCLRQSSKGCRRVSRMLEIFLRALGGPLANDDRRKAPGTETVTATIDVQGLWF